MEKKSITSRSFVRMSEDIFEHDGDTIAKLEYLLDSDRYPNLSVSLPLQEYHGYVNVEYLSSRETLASNQSKVSLEFRMYSSTLVHPLMRCFINGVPSSKEVKVVFDGIRLLVSHLNEYRENLESIGWWMSKDEGVASRKVRDDLEIRLQRVFSKNYKDLMYDYSEKSEISKRASKNVFFMTEEFRYSFQYDGAQMSHFALISGWELFSATKYAETVLIPRVLEDRTHYPEYAFYTSLEHIAGLSRNLVDLMVNPLSYHSIGRGTHFWTDGDVYHIGDGLMDVAI